MPPTPRRSTKKTTTRRRSASTKNQPTSPESPPDETSGPGSPPSPNSSLGLIGEAFRRPERGAPQAASAAELDKPAYEPPKPRPIEWDPERAQTVLKGMGWLLHSLDPVADSPYAPDLWKMTEGDLETISEPVSRIANRYATARGLAGFSDEVGVGLGLAPYVKRNLAERGRAKSMHARDQRALEDEHADRYRPEQPAREPAREPARSQPDGPPEPVVAAPPPPSTEPIIRDHGEPEDEELGVEQNPKLDVDDVFGGFGAGSELRRPPHETSHG